MHTNLAQKARAGRLVALATLRNARRSTEANLAPTRVAQRQGAVPRLRTDRLAMSLPGAHLTAGFQNEFLQAA